MATHSILFLGKPHGWRNLVHYSLWGCKESDVTKQLHFHFLSFLCFGQLCFILQIFSPSLCPSNLSFHSHDSFFHGTEITNFSEVQLVLLPLLLYLKLASNPRSPRNFLLFYLLRGLLFCILHLSLIHFELMVRVTVSVLNFLFFHVAVHLLQHYVL